MGKAKGTLGIWQTLARRPGGKWLFSRLVCHKAPYFGTITPRFRELRPGYAEVSVAKTRRVLNHIGTVHAIAMCNMAELAGGTMTEVSIPSTHRWIPKGMAVEYLKKAATDVVAIATPVDADADLSVARDYDVAVLVQDAAGDAVFKAVITMWVSPRKP